MFLGEYEYSIDQKGRVAIPARFREAFREGLVLFRGFDKCINVYPVGEWKKIAQRLASLPLTRHSSRRLSRATFSSAFSLQLDRAGRVLLPPPLRQYAEIKEEVVIAGVYSYLEIWDREAWAEECLRMSQQAGEIAESVDLGP